MCHESRGARYATIGIGKGTVRLDDFHHADVILVVGQNPGTNHPRMLTSLERAKERGATIVAVNPMPEAGLIGFRNPQKVRGVLGRSAGLADHHLAIRVGGDLALFQLVNADSSPGGARPGLRRRPCRRLRARGGTGRRRPWPAARGHRTRPGRRRPPRRPAGRHPTLHHVLGHGVDPAQGLGADDPGDREHPPAPGRHRAAGCGALPRARSQQRAGRPNDGDLGEAARCVPRRLAGEFGFDPPREHGLDTVDAIRAMARGEASLRRHGWQLRLRRARHRRTAAALARAA